MSVSVGAKVPAIISTTTQTHHMEWQVDGWVWCRLIVAGQTGILVGSDAILDTQFQRRYLPGLAMGLGYQETN